MNALLQQIEQAQTIAIGGHVRPDGDCVGSCMGLYNYICENYKQKNVMVFLGEYSNTFEFLQGLDQITVCRDAKQVEETVRQTASPDLFIALDSSNAQRLEFYPIFEKARRTICVDHHVTNEGYAQENLVYDTSSTAEALYDLLSPEKISLAVAEALYMGIVHDTGVFKYSCTTRHTMEVAGALLSLGVNASRIIDDTFYRKTYIQNQLLGRALVESKLYENGRIIAAVIPESYFAFYQASKPDLEGIVDQLRITEGVEVAIFAYQSGPNSFKFSLRSNNYVDVSKISVLFGGGGHIRAAGFTMEEDYETACQKVIAEIQKQLK